MDHPIDRKTFSKLLSVRVGMQKENPNPKNVGIASPFVPWIGPEILKGVPGIYFVGIATYGCGENRTLDGCLAFSKEIATEASPRSHFWRYLRTVAEATLGEEYLKCQSKIAWSNQYKIGIFNCANPNQPLNPYGVYKRLQLPLCQSILKRELRVARRCAVVFLGDGPLIDAVLGEDCDRKRYQNLGVWIKYRENGAPIIYQDHPARWRSKQRECVQAHVKLIKSEFLAFRAACQAGVPHRI
jgi:uracil-DNA glycosylase